MGRTTCDAGRTRSHRGPERDRGSGASRLATLCALPAALLAVLIQPGGAEYPQRQARDTLAELVDTLSNWRNQWRFTGSWRTMSGTKRSPADAEWLKGPNIEVEGTFAVDGPMVRLELRTPASESKRPGGFRGSGQVGTADGVRIIRQDWNAGLRCTQYSGENGVRFALFPVDVDFDTFTAPPFAAVDAGALVRIWFLRTPESELVSVTKHWDNNGNQLVYTIRRRVLTRDTILIDRYTLDVSGDSPVLLEARSWNEGDDPAKAWTRRNESFVDINGVRVPQRIVSYSWREDGSGREFVFVRITELRQFDPAAPEPSAFVIELGEDIAWIQGLKENRFPEDGKLDVAKLTREDLHMNPRGQAASELRLRDGKLFAIVDDSGLRRVGEQPIPAAAEQERFDQNRRPLTYLWLVVGVAVLLASAALVGFARRRRASA